MKQLVLLTALTLATGGAVLAQQAAPAPDAQTPAPVVKQRAPNPSKETARLAKELNLTPDQTAKLEPILSDRDAKLATIKADTALTDDERAEKTKGVRKSTQSQIRAILTPDQELQMQQSRKGKKAGATDAPPPPPPAA